MKRICAWCKKEINTSGNEDDERVSHGICEDCVSNLEFQMGVTLKEYLSSLKFPVMAVTNDLKAIYANVPALEILGKEIDEIYGEFGGDIFECAYARLPEGCGKTYHCSGCAIRNAVRETFEKKTPVLNVQAKLKCDNIEKPEEFDMLISTEMTGNIVLLWIDKLDKKLKI